jgi:hypothetical protein
MQSSIHKAGAYPETGKEILAYRSIFAVKISERLEQKIRTSRK